MKALHRVLPALALALALLLTGCELVPLTDGALPEAVSLSEPQTELSEPVSEPETPPAPQTEQAETPRGHSAVFHGGADADETAVPVYPEFPEKLRLLSGQAFVYDVAQDGIIAMKNPDERLYPASVTKLMTVLTALEYLEPEQLVVPGSELSLVEPDSSLAYLTQEHVVSVETLIEGMLLPSGNDAACALAAAAGRAIGGEDPYRAAPGGMSGEDAVELFVCEMNALAQTLRMRDTRFVTPDGYFDERHYSTAADMARLTVAAYQNELIRRYCGLASDDVVFESGHAIRWENTNEMLDPESPWYSPCVTGMKTGSITGSYCLVAVLEKGGKTYLAGVFTSPDNASRYEDMTAIVNWLF